MAYLTNLFNRLGNWWFFFRLKRGWLPPVKQTKQDRIVMALMTVLDPDLNIGITARASPEALAYLKTSDSPFAGYVISCLVEDDAESKAHYDEWLKSQL
jgi:hypothetical protein